MSSAPSFSLTPTSSPGLIFDKYEVIRRLALGGMGEVFLARQTSSVAGFERLVILKSLLPELAEREGFVDLFLDEARVAATLNHPNIVQVFEVGLWNEMYFIAMEYIRGVNLSHLVRAAHKQSEALPWGASVRMVHDAALGLDHAHFATDMHGSPLSIVHRDVSPQNIMVRSDGVTKVVDFGIAKASNRMTRTATGTVKGKLRYMAPEQLRGEDVDHRADQFALGVILWELLSGEGLFASKNEVDVIRDVLEKPIPPLTQLQPSLPRELSDVVARMLERDPDRRFQRCADVARDLKATLDATPQYGSDSALAWLIKNLVGSELEDQTRDLTPASANFVVDLRRSAEGTPATHTDTSTVSAKGIAQPDAQLLDPTLVDQHGGGRRAPLVAAAIGVVLLAFAGAFLLTPATSTEAELPELPVKRAAASSSAPDVIKPEALPVRLVQDPVASKTELHVEHPHGAQVYVDDRLVGTAPLVVRDLTPGPHRVRIVMADGDSEEHTVNVTPSGPPVVRVESTPAGATVFVGDVAYGVTPVRLDKLAPGVEHVLRAVLPGHEAATVKVAPLAAGEERTVEMVLEPVASQPAAAKRRRAQAERAASRQDAPEVAAQHGFLSLTTSPWTRVEVNGEPYGSTPLFKKKVPAGRHKLLLVNEQAGVRAERVIVVKPGEVKKLSIALQ